MSEDIRVTCIEHVTYARRVYVSSTTVLEKKESTTNFNTAYVPLQVIFVHVDKASIPTLLNLVRLIYLVIIYLIRLI